MRITQRAVALTSLQGLNRNLDAVGRLQQQLTSGRLINAPSDSPTGTNRAMQTRVRAGRRRAAGAQHQRRPELAGPDRLHAADDARHHPPGAGPHGAGARTPARCRDQPDRRWPPRSARCARGCSRWRTPTIQGRPLFGGVTAGRQGLRRHAAACVGVARHAGHPADLGHREDARRHRPAPRRSGPPGDDLFAVVGDIATDLTANPAALDGPPGGPRRGHEEHA